MIFLLIYIVGGIFLLIAIIGYAAPRITKIAHSIEINTTIDAVWPQLNCLENFHNNWSPWREKDLNAKNTFNEIKEGKGAKFMWDGESRKVGKGSMEIVDSVENRKVKTLLTFVGRGQAYASWIIKDKKDGTVKVTWDFESDNGMNPIARIFGLMMDKFLGPDYKAGLANLKDYLE